MQLDNPVAKYLPESVKMPTYGGKQITLHHLATHMSRLPGIPDNLDPKRADNPYTDYTVEKMDAFLSGDKLTRDPGAESVDSNLGMGLLGQAIARQAGTSYESLVVERMRATQDGQRTYHPHARAEVAVCGWTRSIWRASAELGPSDFGWRGPAALDGERHVEIRVGQSRPDAV